MPVTCRLEDTARPVVNLDSPHLSAVRRLGAARNVQAVTELLRQRVPGLSVEEGYYDDPRPAWWEAGQVVINLNRADVSSPIHELSEIWGAVYEQQQPEAYQQTLEMMRGTEAHERTMQGYPDLDETGQLREALHLQVQQDAGKYLGGGRASSPVRRLWGFVAKLLHRLSGGLSPQRLSKLQDGKLTIAELTQALAKELVLGQGGVLSELSADDLTRLGGYARDQRLTNEMLESENDDSAADKINHQVLGITNARELLQYVSGRTTNGAGQDLTRLAQQKVRDWGGKSHFIHDDFYDEQGRRLPRQQHDWTSGDEHERIQQVLGVLRDAGAAPDGLSVRLTQDLFYRLREPLKQSEESDGRPAGISEQEAELAYGPHGIFPAFVPGDRVVSYGRDALGDDYHAALDTGNLLVHVNRQGQPVAVAAITRQRLGESKNSRNLLSGLQYYRDRKGTATGGTGQLGTLRRERTAGKVERVSLTNSAEQLQKLQAQLLAMHLTKRGHRLQTVTVANIRSLDAGAQRQNAVTRVLPVAELKALESIGRQAPVRQLLDRSGQDGQYLLELLSDKQLRQPELYFTDYLGSLQTNFKGADAYSEQKIKQFASAHERDNNEASLNNLLQVVTARRVAIDQQYVAEGLSEDEVQQQLNTNPEYLQLVRAEMQLRQVSDKLNPHHTLGSLEKAALDYNNNPEPAMVFLVNRYKALKDKINKTFLPKAMQRRHLIEQLRAQKGTSWLVDKEQDLYTNLIVHEKAWQKSLNSSTGKSEYEQVQVPAWRFKLPGSEAFNQLTKAEQEFIVFELAQIKEQFVGWHRQSHRNTATGEPGSEQEALRYYEKEWSAGQIPLTPASASARRLQGDWLGSYQDSISELLGQNPYFDDPGGQRLQLVNYYHGQGGGSEQGGNPWGESGRRRLLGIERTNDVHPDTGEALKFVVQDDWKKTQAHFDQDLGRGQAIWSAEMLRQEHGQQAAYDYKMAQALLNDQQRGSALLRHFVPGQQLADGGDSAGDGQRTPGYYAWSEGEQSQNLKKMFRQLFHYDTQQGGGTADAQKLYRAAGVAASLFRTAIYKGNVLRPIKQTISGLVGQLAPILAAQSSESRKILDPQHVRSTAEFMANPQNWNFALQLGVHLDVVSPHARMLAQNPLFTGKGVKASDVLSLDARIDKLGDELLSLTTMVLHLKTSGAWSAYSWDADKKEFSYSEAADRKSRGDAAVDSVRTNLVANGLLEPGEALGQAYDLPLLRSLESSVCDVKGGYSPTSSSELGATVLGSQLLGQRRWYVRRVLNAVGRKRVSAARGYKDSDGKWVGLIEEGQWQSFKTALAQLDAVSFNPMKLGQVWSELEPHEQENLQRVASNAAVTLSAMLAVMAVAALWDDDEDEKNKKRSRQMSVMDTIIQEASLFENSSFALDAAANPFIMAAWLKQVSVLPWKLLTGDWQGAGRIVESKTGAGKTVSAAGSLFADDKE